MMAFAAEVCAVVLLGITAGAVAAEGAVLVPYWRALAPADFLAWYGRYGALLVKFFGPLEVVAAAATIAAAMMNGAAESAALWFVAAVLAAAVLAMFPFYFRRVNASFSSATIAPALVAAELRRWAALHWLRVALAVGAFVAAVLAIADRAAAAQ